MMAISYSLRLACLVAGSMGLVQVGFEVGLWLLAPGLVRVIDAMTLRQRERALYGVQLLPFAGALAITGLFCVPQYVANETNFAPEGVGWVCLALAATVAGWWAAKLFGGLRMAVRTMQFDRACRLGDAGSAVGSDATPVILGAGSTPRVALVGLMRPFIFISKSLVGDGGLNAQALEIVFDHERSHAAQGDNWKLLSLYCLPRLGLKLRGGKTWKQLWQNAAEWAADEDAVRGNSARAFLLAETLVALARSASPASREVACTNFICDETELALRVERLIERRQVGVAGPRYGVAVAIFVALAGAAVLLASQASALHELPERLLHLG